MRGGDPAIFSFRMSGIVASFGGGDLLKGEFLICSKKRRSYMIRVPACAVYQIFRNKNKTREVKDEREREREREREIKR